MSGVRLFLAALALLFANLAPISGHAQTPVKRLILKDGSYQVVTQYMIRGDRVRYFSADREEWEELPTALVDWPATNKWAKDHVPGASVSPANSEAAAIDKEEQEEKAEQMARTPEIFPGLRLPDEVGVWVLDTFQGQLELVPLVQDTGDINRRTGHDVLRSALNPSGGLKQTIELSGATAKIRLHVDEPVIYVSLTTQDDGSNASNASAGSLTVDTHGAGSVVDKNSYSSPTSKYAIVRVHSNMRRNYRVVAEIKVGSNGNVLQTDDTMPTTAEVLPGRHWLKLTPRSPLTIGDYALMEILDSGEVNASIWDFSVDPQAPDNQNTIMPLERSSR